MNKKIITKSFIFIAIIVLIISCLSACSPPISVEEVSSEISSKTEDKEQEKIIEVEIPEEKTEETPELAEKSENKESEEIVEKSEEIKTEEPKQEKIEFSLDEGKTAIFELDNKIDVKLKKVYSDNKLDLIIGTKGEYGHKSNSEIQIDEKIKLKILDTFYNVKTEGKGSYVKFIMLANGKSIQGDIYEGQTKTYIMNDKRYDVKAAIVSKLVGVPVIKFEINDIMTDTLKDGEDDYFNPGTRDKIIVLEILPQEAQETVRRTYANFELIYTK